MTSAARWSRVSGNAAVFAFLLFLYFPVADLVGGPEATTRIAIVLAGAAVFVAVYLSLMLDRSALLATRSEWLRLGLLLVLAVVLAFGSAKQEWASLFIYVAAIAGFRTTPPFAVPAILGCAALAAAAGVVRDYDVDATISYTLYALAIGLLLMSLSRLVHAYDELDAARGELARLAVADERLRFARDLHDLLGHSLSVIALKSELAGRLLGRDPERAAAEVAEVEQVAREALGEVRDAVSGYRRMTLADELAGARMALTAAGIAARVEQTAAALAPETESILAWAVREGTTNVIRHSGARRCEIRVSAGPAGADVEVVDDGVGGDGRNGGSGLAGLAERAWRRQGGLEAGPRPEGGFRLRVSVPA